MRPGTNQTIQSQNPQAAAPVDFSAWLISGITAQGPLTPQPANSLSAWQTIYGGRGTAPIMSDSVETFFNEGGTQVWTTRVVGPGAVFATANLVDTAGSPATTLVVDAIGPGAYANGIKVVATNNTTTYTLTVEDASSNVLETSGVLTTLQDAVNYGKTSAYITIALASSVLLPKTQTITLASGADDITDVVTSSYTTAATQFVNQDANTNVPATGMISFPGQTSAAAVEALATLVSGTPYVAVADLPDGVTSASTLVADMAPYTALGAAARQLGVFYPWLDITPAAGTSGPRGVPPSAFYAGRKSALIFSTNNPNLAAAGPNGLLSSATNAHATFSSSDRQTLNTAGVNIIRPTPSGFKIYGNVTAVNRQSDPLYFMLSNSHLDGAIEVQAEVIQEDFMFSEIDGQGLDVADFVNELVSMMTNWWTLGALFGPDGTSLTAFSVAPAETPIAAAAGELLATIAYARSPSAEQVNLNIVRDSAATGV